MRDCIDFQPCTTLRDARCVAAQVPELKPALFSDTAEVSSFFGVAAHHA